MPLLNVTEMHERLPFRDRAGAGPAAAPSSTTTSSIVSTALSTSLKIAEKVAEKASTTATDTLATSLSSINMSDGSSSPHISLTNTSTSTTNSIQTTTSANNNNHTSLALIITSVMLILLTLASLTAALYALYKLWQQNLNLQYLTTQLKSLLLTHNLAFDPSDPNTNTYTSSSAEMEGGGAPPYDSAGDDAKSLEQSEAWPVHPGTS
ncbi:hypothetical protein EJ03DRAFT_351996 [Teratosphaeria nubilosa]|uniref:Uncharacterized protein n=1 Tax=Teratosphaeria nubilosa TaxID=161662 RepID=A0A6G1L6R8_9PEZI|nr:hypothetical protein EJ03DRAFT_351996 [Teratosphaeria nubilosa]